jgi:outer membrane receptor protein involved in Fe transport
MAFSYGTANWGYVDSHTIAIRGISGFGTTGVYIDETPVPDSLDPRVVDIDRIEILKGPQGTLFGQSSLGGNLRLITVQPTPGRDDGHYSVKMGKTAYAGSPDYGADVADTFTLDRTLAARVVAYYDHEGGFLNRDAVDPINGQTLANVDNYGAERSYGGSVSLRWLPSERIDTTLRVMMQDSLSDGWSAPYAPLPNFQIQTLTMNRTNDVQERAEDRFVLPSLQLNYKGDGYSVHESLSYFNRDATQIEDGSEGTRDALVADWYAYYPQIAQYLNNYYPTPAGLTPLDTPFAWSEQVTYRRTTSETRVSFDKSSFGLSGVTGLYLSKGYSDTMLQSGQYSLIQSLGLNTNAATGGYCVPGNMTVTSCPTYGSGEAWYSRQPSTHYDEALFGELYEEIGKYELTLGLRAYRQEQSTTEIAAGALNFAYFDFQTPNTKQTGVTPKLALKYNIDKDEMVYATAAKGFRAGGAGVPLPAGATPAAIAATQTFLSEIHQTAGQATTYTSDFVWNYEVGGKMATPDHHYSVNAALFQMNWTNIQQTIIAPVSYITLIVNAGDAVVRGGELEVDARPVSDVELHAGVGYEDATISSGALYWQPTGSPVYNVPKVTANASGTFTMPLEGETSAFLTLDGSYTGASYSGTAGCQLNTATAQYFPCPSVSATDLMGSAPRRAGFSVFNARVGLDFGQSQLALYAQNLFNARPNLGDFNPESYAKHSTDPAQYDPAFGVGYIVPRVATLRPFAMGLTWRHRF